MDTSDENVCPICVEPLQKDPLKFQRYLCCGNGIHIWCSKNIKLSSLSDEQKDRCPLCRAHLPSLDCSEEEIIKTLRPWVDRGKAWAQHMLGQEYERAHMGTESQAVELYELAARQGYIAAQYNLAHMLQDGRGVDQNYERAAALYKAAATQGNARAQVSLGILYVTGNGVERSREEARKWWMKSAEQGNENAIRNIEKLDKTRPFVPKPFECANCYRRHDPPNHTLKPCARCQRVFYCGRECQKQHWKKKVNGHKGTCKSAPATLRF